jgi:hypothetical protein
VSTGTFDSIIRGVLDGAGKDEDLSQQYNTQLSPEQEKAFQQTPYARDTYDYDARGEFAAGSNRDNPTGHGRDTFKKPNHPTFSTGSQYSTGNETGGQWIDNGDGTWGFMPSATNDDHMSRKALLEYMRAYEPYTRVLPQRR